MSDKKRMSGFFNADIVEPTVKDCGIIAVIFFFIHIVVGVIYEPPSLPIWVEILIRVVVSGMFAFSIIVLTFVINLIARTRKSIFVAKTILYSYYSLLFIFILLLFLPL